MSKALRLYIESGCTGDDGLSIIGCTEFGVFTETNLAAQRPFQQAERGGIHALGLSKGDQALVGGFGSANNQCGAAFKSPAVKQCLGAGLTALGF